MGRKSLRNIIYILLSSIIIIAFNIANTYIMAIFVAEPYTPFFYQLSPPYLDNDGNIVEGEVNYNYYRDLDFFFNLLLEYTDEYEENIFFQTSSQYTLNFIGDSAYLDKFISEKNTDFPEDEPELYIMENTHLLELYTDDYILNAYPEQYEVTGILNSENKHSFLFKELTDAQLLVELVEPNNANTTIIVPNKFARELARELQAIEADEESDLLDSYTFSWVGFGIEDTKSFIKYNFSSFENPSYVILSLSLFIGYLYVCIYYFQKLRYVLKVNTYFGLSKELNNRNMFWQQFIVFLLSTVLTLVLTYIAPNYSLVTWQEVYVPVYFVSTFLLAILFPALLIWRNNQWLEKSRGK